MRYLYYIIPHNQLYIMTIAVVKQIIAVLSNVTSRTWTDLTPGLTYVFTVS